MKLLKQRRYLLIGTVIFAVLLGSCKPERVLVGRWTKITSDLCAVAQPSQLQFFSDGTYVGSLPNWKGGNYKVVSPTRVKLDTTTGSGEYTFKLEDGHLVFINESGCEYRYRPADN